MSQSDIKIESYPPLFRQSNPNQIVDSDDDQAIEQVLDSDALPVIDFQCIDHGKLSEACKDWGMFRLVNHGIPVALLNQLDEQPRELFSLTFESKQSLFTGPITYFWGTPALTPSGVAIEGSALSQNFNWVEGLNVPLSQTLRIEAEDDHRVVRSFRVVLEEYGSHLYRVAATLYEAMVENLQLGPEESKPYMSPTTGLVRVYRYPRYLKPEPHKQPWGMDVHTDSSVLSILLQDQVGGLQVYKDDEWLDVKTIPTTLLVNLGDMMQAISDDKYRSVKHRVKVNNQKERISIGYFVFPAEDAVIESSRYKPFTYADFRAQVQQDLKSIGFKVGLSRFKRNGNC